MLIHYALKQLVSQKLILHTDIKIMVTKVLNNNYEFGQGSVQKLTKNYHQGRSIYTLDSTYLLVNHQYRLLLSQTKSFLI